MNPALRLPLAVAALVLLAGPAAARPNILRYSSTDPAGHTVGAPAEYYATLNAFDAPMTMTQAASGDPDKVDVRLYWEPGVQVETLNDSYNELVHTNPAYHQYAAWNFYFNLNEVGRRYRGTPATDGSWTVEIKNVRWPVGRTYRVNYPVTTPKLGWTKHEPFYGHIPFYTTLFTETPNGDHNGLLIIRESANSFIGLGRPKERLPFVPRDP